MQFGLFTYAIVYIDETSINSWIISPFSGFTFLYFQQDFLYLREFLVETFQSS